MKIIYESSDTIKIVYLPIDDRPCNTKMVRQIANSSREIDIILPDKKHLGKKKTPADTERIWKWLNNQASEADAIILNVEMLVYGGLIPSRLHQLTYNEGLERLNRLKELKKSYPHKSIYVSNVIMRTPKYSSSDEEPDYYEKWGRDLYLRSYLYDKKSRAGLTIKEQSDLDSIEARLPDRWIKDYERRREYNLKINEEVLKLVDAGFINFLSIPQDDSSEYGYTMNDMSKVARKQQSMNLFDRVHIYPGADEVGSTLLLRAYNEYKKECPKIYPFWSSTLGPQLTPLYENRPFGESLKAHVLAAGCQLTDSDDKADIILAYNAPGYVMQESWEQANKDVTYDNFRHLKYFVEQIHSFVLKKKNVVIADSAFANGGEYELIKQLDNKQILDRLISYKGWNTNCNTLGSTISQGVIGLNGIHSKVRENICYHLLDDYFYQSDIRMEMTNNFLPEYELTYFDLKDKAALVNEKRNSELKNKISQQVPYFFEKSNLQNITTYAPWNRMFECDFELDFNKGVE